MRICLATTHVDPHPGGIAHYYTCLSRLLTNAGHSVILLTITDDAQETADKITHDGNFTKVVLAVRYQQYRSFYRDYFRPGSYAADKWIATGMAMQNWLISHAAEYKIDLIETMDFGGAGIFLKQTGLPPLIIDAHSSALQISEQAPMVQDDHLSVIRQLEKLAFTFADAIIAHSPMNQEELKRMGYPQTFFSRAPWLPSAEPAVTRKPQKKLFLVISSLQLIKGAELMIQAAFEAAKKDPDICIYWAGEDSYSAPGGALTSSYLSEKYPDTWAKQFRWLGYKNKAELHSLLADVTAVIIPSVWDTFNYVVPETIMAGIPLVLSDKTGAGYLISDHPLVRTFNAGSQDELASILVQQELFSFRDRFDELQQKTRDYFSVANILQERELIYNHVTEKQTAPDMLRINQDMRFLERYLSRRRKLYYQLRKKIKQLIRPVFNKLSR